jgi:hypothetical protein
MGTRYVILPSAPVSEPHTGGREGLIMMNGTRPALRTIPDEPGQAARLRRFRDEHPGISVRPGTGYWQACIPEANGETVLTRYLLRDLLDKVDDVLCERQQPDAGRKGDAAS